MSDIILDFMSIFEGPKTSHGRYTIDAVKSTDKKVGVNNKAVRKELKPTAIEEHLKGIRGVQVTPINEENKCKWGCLDVDEHKMSVEKIEQIVLKIKSKGLPLIACRARSGGLHIFLFLKEFVEARIVRLKLKNIAIFLDLDLAVVEVFPKQDMVLHAEGQCGSRLSLPYFGCFTDTGTFEYAYYYCNEALVNLSLQEFLNKIETVSIDIKELKKIKATLPPVLEEAPPCLDTLCYKGVESFRNNFLFNMGVYAKKKYPDTWKKFLDKANRDYCKPPKSQQEVANIIHSISKRDYNYKCSEAPIVSCCNVRTCRKRKFGIGSESGLPLDGSLTKLKTDPPLWFLTLDSGQTIMLTTEELQSQNLFQRACIQKMNIMVRTVKKQIWEEALQNILAKVEEEEAPPSTSPKEMFRNMLITFLHSFNTTDEIDNLLRGYAVKRDNNYYFTFQAFIDYLDTKRFNEVKGRNKQIKFLKEIGCSSTSLKVQNEKIFCFKILAYNIETPEEEIEDPFK